MSIELWREFLGELASVPQISRRGYRSLKENSLRGYLQRAFLFMILIGTSGIVTYVCGKSSVDPNFLLKVIIVTHCYFYITMFVSNSSSRWKNRVMNQNLLQQIISKYVDKFDNIGVKITASQSYMVTTITVEADI
jgi:hypothetical protein